MALIRTYMGGTASAIAPVAAIPTTAAQLSLWNGEPVGGKSYTITAVSFTPTASAAAAFVAQLLVHCAGPSQPVISGTAGKGPIPTDGQPTATRSAVLGAVTLSATTLASGVWHPVGQSVNGGAATATISMGGYQQVKGLYVLPPGGQFSMAVLCSAAGSAQCQLFVQWEEA